MSEPTDLTIYDLLKRRAELNSDDIAVVSPQRASLTYRQLLDQVDSTIESLESSGITRRHRVALVLPGGPELATAFLAVSSIATAVPLNPAYRESEFDFYFSDLEPEALIVDSVVDSPAAAAAGKRGIDVIELRPCLDRGAGSFSLLTSKRDLAGTSKDAHGDDIALVLYTSGTTSKPKRVPLTHRNLRTSAENIAVSLGLSASDRCLNIMPLFHIHGLVGGLLSSLSAAGSVAIPPDFRGASFYTWLAELRPTWYTAVPPMHDAILRSIKAGQAPPGSHSLRFIRSSSAPLTPKLMAEMEAVFQVPVIQAYGMTEASHQIASNPLPPRERKPGSVGKPTRTDVAVMDEDGKLVAAGDTGEVVLRGANVTSGYENNRAANETAFTDGWFRTGDQGYFDSDGYIFLTGRLKELINRGGEKVSPIEIEAVLSDHRAVSEAVAFPMPHRTLGEEVAAAVVVKSGLVLTPGELREFAARRLADFKVPRHIELVERIPRSATGKVQRVQLASQLGLDSRGAGLTGKQEAFVGPRTDLEAKVANIWCQVLRLEEVSVHDTFFSLGGDSLAAVEAISQLSQTLNIDLESASFSNTPTVAAMAELVRSLLDAESGQARPATTNRGSDQVFSYLVQLQRGRPDRPVFFFPGGGGDDSEFFYLMRLVKHLPPDYMSYGFRARSADGLRAPHSCVEEMAADYIAELQTVQPEGPYVLIGDCIGGAVAVEVARQLAAAGQTIASLILLDSERPTTLKYCGHRVASLKRDIVAGIARRWKTARRGLSRVLHGDVGLRLRTRMNGGSGSASSASVETSQKPINPAADISRAAGRLRHAVLRYRARAYDGQIKLVVNEKWHRRNATLGWAKIATRGVQSYAAPGEHLTYLEAGERARTIARQIENWIEGARGSNEDTADRRLDASSIESTAAPLFLTERLADAREDLADVVPLDDRFILVDEGQWGSRFLENRVAIPFLEKDGQYAGYPPNDATAIRELERLRAAGATFIVFGWPAFWWLDRYEGLCHFLQRFPCVLRNGRVVVFDLRANQPVALGLDRHSESYGIVGSSTSSLSG
jgi:acyl-CoA synthetase (AMP-forming)/AMP-acid ligase II/thioesterase domain-containing protein/acyl carrier protein